jgi:predicted alpha/beta superfamily hydrolase
MEKTKAPFLIISFLFFSALIASAQDGYTLKKDSLQSYVLSQNRKFSVYLPEGYEADTNKYPVIYVLDADGRDQHTVPTARFLFLNSKMPKAIIVGVMNIDRNHDFLPDSAKGAPTGGGADNFIRFFEKELIPCIDKNFRTENFRVLVGHSYGGLFAMHVLLNDPALFDAYIAIDPSIWYNGKKFLKSAAKGFSSGRNWNRSVFITGREGEGMDEMGISSLDTLMKASSPKEMNWKIVTYADEDHGSVTFKSVYDGLRYIFDSGGSLRLFPDTGIVPPGMTFTVYLWNINPSMRYTTDGSEPTADSPKCQNQIELTGGCTLKVRNVNLKYKNYPTATFIYRQDDFMKGLQSVNNLKPGLKYQYYEGAWDSLPDFSKLKPLKSGITENANLKDAVKKDSFALRLDGYLHITEKELYYFWISSDDGSQLYINNQLILNNNGIHSADLPRVSVIPLTPGYYPLTIKYFEKNGNESLSAGMIKGKENPSPEPFAKELLFYRK